jgi:hypothetical protein
VVQPPQAVPDTLQGFGEQDTVCTEGQIAEFPGQLAGSVAVPEEQLASRQGKVLGW